MANRFQLLANKIISCVFILHCYVSLCSKMQLQMYLCLKIDILRVDINAWNHLADRGQNGVIF